MSKNKSSGEKRQQLLEMRSILDSDLRQQGHCALATQRRAVQEAAAQERAVIASLAAGLAPCVGQEAALVREVEQAEEVVARMVAAVARDQAPECEALLGPGPATFRFVTPPPSPGPGSVLGSRTGSLRSLASSSRPASVASDCPGPDTEAGLGRSRNNSVSSYQSLNHQSSTNNKRYSTISTKSRDSGFSSQELVMLRQQEAVRQGGGQVVTRRPPLPPAHRSRPLVPERKSSLDRCNLTNGNNTSNNSNLNTSINSNTTSLNSSFNSNLNTSNNLNTSFKSNLNSSFNNNLNNLMEAATPTNTGHTVVQQVRSNPPSDTKHLELSGHSVLCCVARS